MALFLSGFLPGLAVGLGIGALAEVAKKTIRHNGAAGNSNCFIFAVPAGLKLNEVVFMAKVRYSDKPTLKCQPFHTVGTRPVVPYQSLETT